MSLKERLQSAEAKLQAIMQEGYLKTFTLAGTTYRAAVFEDTGMVESAAGGFKQGRTATITIACARIAESVLFDTTTGLVKRSTLTIGTTSYRIKSASSDPHGTNYTIECEAAVV